MRRGVLRAGGAVARMSQSHEAAAHEREPWEASMTSKLLRAIVITVVVLAPVPSLAQNPSATLTDVRDAVVLAPPLAREADTPGQFISLAPPPRRPAILPALYASYGAMQVLDAYTTVRATARGGIERNPVLAPVAGNFAALLAVKAGLAASTIFFTERLWKEHRTAAIVAMIAANGVVAAAAAYNARQLRGQRR